MEHRKRSVAGGTVTNATAYNIEEAQVSMKLHSSRPSINGRTKRSGQSSLLPLGLIATGCFFIFYAIVSHYFLTSLSSEKQELGLATEFDRIFHQTIPKIKNLRISYGKVDSSYLPERPRSVGYYFLTSLSHSFFGAERLDPNVIRFHHSRHAKLYVDDKEALEAVEAQKKLMNSADYTYRRTDRFESGDCVAQYDWQKSTFPTCNHLMETDMTDLSLKVDGRPSIKMIGGGYWRDVWLVQVLEQKVVLKTIRYEHDFEDRNYDRHRRDAVAMERLTSSESIMNIYGFCGNSGLFEFADGGSVEDNLWYAEPEDRWNSTERLIVAYQVATGVAETHNFGMEGRASIAHTDITTSQFVYVSEVGIFKLNDFNRCRFITWNKKLDKACPYRVGNNPGTFRSPEEYAYADQSEKVDVYSMGNVFYSILTLEWPFYKVKPSEKAHQMVADGIRPKIADKFFNSTDPFDIAMLKCIEMCWIQDPKQRATARELQNYIKDELNRLGVKQTR